MKNNIKYIKRIGIFVLALVMTAACVKWEQETSPPLESASTVTLAVLSSGDSSVVVSFSSTANGYVGLNLFSGTGNEVPTELEDREAMLTGNVTSMEYYSEETEAGTVYQYTFEGLVHNTVYEVMGVANNSDGVVSQVELLPISTGDSHPPVLTGTDPEVGYSPVLPVSGPVTLYFDEPVLYDDTKDLTFSEFYAGEDVVAGSVVADGNMVTVTPGEDFDYREIVMLSYPGGAFTDLSGNPVDTMDSYFDGAGMVGLYWRVEETFFEAVSISPEEEVVPTAFDIVVTFSEQVRLTDAYGDPYIGDGDITLTYDSGSEVLIRDVSASEVSAAGNELTITQSYAAGAGVEVTLDIPEDLFDVGNRNPNAEVTASWNIELTLDDLVGNYIVNAVSYSSPGAWDEVWTATVALVSGNDTALSITIDAGAGGGLAFLAGFDVVSWTAYIPEATSVGDIYGLGPTIILGSDAAYLGGPVYGTITGGSSFAFDELGMYIPDYDWGDGTYGAFWDAFNTTWTKSATKAAVSGGSINPSKISRAPSFK
ncbi:MAG: Ig-like domain-containing protein [Bacteroidota bacterium]|nr:Ig-like domain-containing protein [Bacteroidota bacterium]